MDFFSSYMLLALGLRAALGWVARFFLHREEEWRLIGFLPKTMERGHLIWTVAWNSRGGYKGGRSSRNWRKHEERGDGDRGTMGLYGRKVGGGVGLVDVLINITAAIEDWVETIL